jgi:hypothetical protein
MRPRINLIRVLGRIFFNFLEYSNFKNLYSDVASSLRNGDVSQMQPNMTRDLHLVLIVSNSNFVLGNAVTGQSA